MNSASFPLRLGLNIDHVATVRNARGGIHPDPVRAALLGQKAGVDGITAHLREDRRHIRDSEIFRLKTEVDLPLNLEMAATDEMLAIALRAKPNACCIVPEKRQEVTTEGGLNVVASEDQLKRFIVPLKEKGIRVSLFVDADLAQIDAAARLHADIIELHTGSYVHAEGVAREDQLRTLIAATEHAAGLGLEVHAGHGLTYDTVAPIAAIAQIVELNIGHFLIGEAIYVGLEKAIAEMQRLMRRARESKMPDIRL